jgi:hypothetical protein
VAAGASTYASPHLYLTVSDQDENEVLELVRVDETGMYVRDAESWVPINPDDDNPRVWDRIIIDLTESAVPVFDSAETSDAPITADLFSGHLLPEDEQ